ncbi:MAG: hypothetical protein HW386_501 [Gammaproteobacteria bacterium]|nr:hypothetical protein [Gammaproteobacteria bacterium]
MKYGTGYDFLYTNGMPIRYVAIPFPVAGQPASVHKRYVEGIDPHSGKPMMTAIIDALTQPLTEQEKFAGIPPEAEPEPRLLKPDTEENLHRLFKDKDWTDYNPIILPTEERVAAMLKGTSHKPDEVVNTINWPGGARALTVEKAAVTAVMAGAKPEYFPLILAIATQVPFGNSTSSMANMIVVNGPVVKEIGMNAGTNAMGPHNDVNAVIGRTFTLMSKTVGNLHSGVTTWSTLGSNLQYNNLTIAENEEKMPEGWEALHVQMGFKPGDSVVTIGTGWTYISSVGEVQRAYPPQNLIRDYMRSLTAIGSSATIIMDPTVAALLKETQGFNTKKDFSTWLSGNVEKTAASFWGNGVVSTSFASVAMQGLEPYASWYKLPPDTLIKPFNNPRGIQVLVVGGAIQTTWFVTDFRLGRGVLVDDWR